MEKVNVIYLAWEWQCPACKCMPFNLENDHMPDVLKCHSCGAEFEPDWEVANKRIRDELLYGQYLSHL